MDNQDQIMNLFLIIENFISVTEIIRESATLFS